MREIKPASVAQSAALGVRNAAMSHLGQAIIYGGLSGMYLLTFCHQFATNFGHSLSAMTGLGLALAAGVQLGVGRSSSSRTSQKRPLLRLSLAVWGLAVWTVAFGWLVNVMFLATGTIPMTTLAVPAKTLLYFVLIALMLFFLPAYWMARLPSELSSRFIEHRQRTSDARALLTTHAALVRFYLLGIAGGLLLGAFVLVPSLGVQTSGLLAALVGGCLFLADVSSQIQEVCLGGEAAESKTPITKTSNHPTESLPNGGHTPGDDRTWSRAESIQRIATFLCFGALLAGGSRLMSQLILSSSYLIVVQWAALAAGVAVGMWWRDRRRKQEPAKPAAETTLLLCVAAWFVGLLGLYPLLMDGLLALNTHVHYLWLIMLARSVVAGLVFFGVGFGCGGLAVFDRPLGTALPRSADQSRSGSGDTRIGRTEMWGIHPLAVAAGFVLIRWVGFQHFAPVELLIATAWALSALAAIRWLQDRRLPSGWWRRMATAGTMCLIAVAPLFAASCHPSMPARLLFASEVFMAKRMGVEGRLLPVLDEGRLLATVESRRSTYTLWRHRGVQIQIRENGSPRSTVSTNPDICPEFSAEVMQAVMPLVLHDHPQRVLVLGLGGGVPLSTCLAFPVSDITCVEDDARLIELVEENIWPEAMIAGFDDRRVRLVQLEPALAVAGADDPYDVIISSPGRAEAAAQAPYFTLEFYRRVAGRLSRDGIFCQNFGFVDFGAEPLRVVARTLQTVFTDVAAVEVAPSVWMLLGTNSEKGITRDELIKQFRRPHVRLALSRLGWDWTVPFNVPAYRHDALKAIAAQTQTGINTAANGRFAFSLPQEVARWGTKWQEKNAALAQHAGRLLDAENVDGNDPELLRRLSEVAAERRLMTGYPDQKWSYRKSLREQMKKQRKSLIHQVSLTIGENELHPQDKRRILYFEALADAARDAQPRPEAIRRLAEFAAPYDPLISYFVHHEAAELYARSNPVDPAAQLHHRLYLAYYADARDRSVRNIVKIVNLLADDPDALSDPQQRFDQINAVLQLLIRRWENRAQDKTTQTKIILNDIEKSISAVKRGVAVMAELTGTLGIPDSYLEAREVYLEKTLIRPLQSYRSRILPHHFAKKRAAAKKTLKKPDANKNAAARKTTNRQQ